jgi:Cgl0159-like
MTDDTVGRIVSTRVANPRAIAEAAATRARRPRLTGASERLFIIAADHPARGSLRAGADPMAMADRAELLRRVQTALSWPGVDGFLGTPDLVEDLLLTGALEGKIVIGSMNRGGLAGTVFEIDDRFTGYDAAAIQKMGFDGGKMLFRVDPGDPATAVTLPILLLGGEATADDSAVVDRWRIALKLPTVRGMVIGRALLYPPDGDVASVVDRTVGLL